jgi:hypothetical protein
MVGRAGELALLTRRWAAARGAGAAREGAARAAPRREGAAGEGAVRDGCEPSGGVCVIRGGGGVGKTRLASELAALAEAGGAIVLHATTMADDPVPLAPVRRAIDRHLAAIGTLPPDARTGALDRIRACAGAAAPLLATLSPALAAAVGVTPGADESDDRQDQFTTAVAGFLTALAADAGGALLVLDDVQWLDASTRRVLVRIAGDLSGVPLLVAAAARTDDPAADEFLTGLGPAVDCEVTLAPLDHDDVAELLRLLVPGSRDELRVLVSRAGGNPMVVREYLRAVVDAGLLRPSWDSWVLDEDGLDALALPQDALGLLLTRLTDLTAEQHALLATAALVGAVFRPEVLDLVHDGRCVEALSDAVARGLLEPRDGGAFAFLHNGIREALVADLDPPAVANQHAAIAAALERLATEAVSGARVRGGAPLRVGGKRGPGGARLPGVPRRRRARAARARPGRGGPLPVPRRRRRGSHGRGARRAAARRVGHRAQADRALLRRRRAVRGGAPDRAGSVAAGGDPRAGGRRAPRHLEPRRGPGGGGPGAGRTRRPDPGSRFAVVVHHRGHVRARPCSARASGLGRARDRSGRAALLARVRPAPVGLLSQRARPAHGNG